MSLNEVREGELKEVFSALEKAFAATGTDFYIIGALARDVWYARGRKTFRGTKDVDIAVLVSSHAEYDAIRNYLKAHNGYNDTKQNAFVMKSPGGIQIDIIPFGEIEIDDSISVKEQGMTSIKVNGFNEVYHSGTAEVALVTGHQFKIATLPAIVLLKFIAFDDRPEHRTKDARDISNIVVHFFDLQADLIYSKHTDLFADEKDARTLEDISAIVIGREIGEICRENQSLRQRMQQILNGHIIRREESIFIRNMVSETGKDVEQCIGWLKQLLLAFTGDGNL